MHCASLGEFEQGRPVLEALKAQYPQYQVALSFFSPSGYEIRKNYPQADFVFYLPVDSPKNAKRLLEMLNPQLVLWVKYEYWFYFLTEINKRNIPLFLISGIFRRSQPFFRWYGGLWLEMLSCFTRLFVQNQTSADLLESIDVKKYELTGDTRFDRVVSVAASSPGIPAIENWLKGRRALVAGSTWEEDIIELSHFVKKRKDLAFIIAPHEILEENIKKITRVFPQSVLYSRLSQSNPGDGDAYVLIIDNIGMLSVLYRYAEVCFVGGGYSANGVHNVLEAAVYGRPVFFGPEHEKFQETIDLLACGGAFSPENPLDLEKELSNLFSNKSALDAAGLAAGKYVREKQGATRKILDYIQRNRLLTN